MASGTFAAAVENRQVTEADRRSDAVGEANIGRRMKLIDRLIRAANDNTLTDEQARNIELVLEGRTIESVRTTRVREADPVGGPRDSFNRVIEAGKSGTATGTVDSLSGVFTR